jgi:hypothetical protein
MTDSLVLQSAIRLACKLLPALLAASIKVSLLLIIALAGAWIMRGTRPVLRRGLWLVAMGGSLLVFVLSFSGPLFHVAGPPQGSAGAFTSLVSSVVLPVARPLDGSSGMPGLAAELWRRASSGTPWIDAWPVLVLFLWVAGVMSGWLSILLGRLHLFNMTRTLSEPVGKNYRGLVRELS